MKLLVLNPIDPGALATLRARHDVICAFDGLRPDLPRLIADREVLIFRSGIRVDAELLDLAPELRLLIRAGSGLDNVDVGHVEERGLRLVRIAEPGAQAVAELAFAFMLALSRQLIEADRSMRAGRWAKYELAGHLLHGKRLGVVGLGMIGTRVARLGLAFGMGVVGCDEHKDPRRGAALASEGISLQGFEQVIAGADYLTIHVPLKASTRHLIDASVLSRIRPGAYVINLSRGGVVDEEALRDALVSGRVRGAALDVHELEGEGLSSPLALLPNVILTPHIGAMAVDAQREIGRRVLETIESATVPASPERAVRAGSP